MQLRVTSLPGDGIGPEVTSQAICVLEEVAGGFGHDLELDEKEIGGVALEKFGNPLPESTLQACLASQAVLLGAVGSPAFDQNPRELRPEAGLLRLRRIEDRRAKIGEGSKFLAQPQESSFWPKFARILIEGRTANCSQQHRLRGEAGLKRRFRQGIAELFQGNATDFFFVEFEIVTKAAGHFFQNTNS